MPVTRRPLLLSPVLVLVLALVLVVDLTSGASTLGLTVAVVPLDSDGGQTVRALFSSISAGSCPSLSGLCAEGDECFLHRTWFPFTGTRPGPGWCVRQWQKTVSSRYSANISLGSDTEFYVSLNATPKIRANSGRLNQPAFIALPPPLRARVKCPHHFHLSVKDLDGDKVRCRFARPERGECLSCDQHEFIELQEEKCTLYFTGNASAGQYFIHLMVEDWIPFPEISHVTNNSPLSSVPVHLSLSVEESSTSCTDEPLASPETPAEDSVMFVVPYDQIKFNIQYISEAEKVSEVAVVGPPELYRTNLTSVGPLAVMTVSWTRSENKLPRLLPICFVANTNSLQSEHRCVWLYQREMQALPPGTELKCGKSEMTLVLPIASLSDINLAELQLNSPTCPVRYNSTHLTASISLSGCGTKTVHSGKELVYTNTLHSVRPYTMVTRTPSLILPLACRIPETVVQGPRYQVSMPTETEVFGQIQVWLEIFLPGEGPLSDFTTNAKFRTNNRRRLRREVESETQSDASSNGSTAAAIGSKIEFLDLHVMSNSSADRAEVVVSECVESEMEDFTQSHPIVEQGCMMSNNALEILTNKTNSRVYRLNLFTLENNGTTMYLQCTVNLCIATMPSQSCPDLCTQSTSTRTLIGSVFSRSYTIRSGPISLVVTTPAPNTTPTAAATANTANTAKTANTNIAAATNNATAITTAPTSSQAPEKTSSIISAVILTTIGRFLQKLVLH